MSMSAYYRKRMMWDLETVFAATTTSPQGQLAAFKRGKASRRALCINNNLCNDAWWKLVDTQLTADDAGELFGRELDPDQLTRALAEKRYKPKAEAIRHNKVEPAVLLEVLEENDWANSLTAATVEAPKIDEGVFRQAMLKVTGWYWLQGLCNPDVSEDLAFEEILNAPASRQGWDFKMLERVYVQKPGLSTRILDLIVSGKSPWGRGVTERMLNLTVASRTFKADSWTKIRRYYGADIKYSLGRLTTLVLLIGNPNSSKVGVTWATKIVHSFYYRVEKKRWVKVNWILESRQRCGVPVTGDWDSDLPLKQQQTLLTLEDDGLFNMPNLRTRKTYYEDDYPGFTWRKGHSLDEVVLRQIGKMDWAERQQWLNTLEAATAPASIMLDAAPEGSWEAFYTLSREWEGSLGELIHAASAL